MPTWQGDERTHCVQLINLPGEDELEDVDLLSYPFIAHEIGHSILSSYGCGFVASFQPVLDELVARLRRQVLPIRGQARQVAEQTTNQIREYWTPTSTHHNWAHEIGIDVLALWLCGPSYLASLSDVMEKTDLNPYQLGQSHPPYDLRARAMIVAAEQLGWGYYTGCIQDLVEAWPMSKWRQERTNLHVACADASLINGAIASALALGKSLFLPRCTPEAILSIEAKLAKSLLPELGIELIVAAWIVRRSRDETAYNKWERQTIRTFLTDR